MHIYVVSILVTLISTACVQRKHDIGISEEKATVNIDVLKLDAKQQGDYRVHNSALQLKTAEFKSIVMMHGYYKELHNPYEALVPAIALGGDFILVFYRGLMPTKKYALETSSLTLLDTHVQVEIRNNNHFDVGNTIYIGNKNHPFTIENLFTPYTNPKQNAFDLPVIIKLKNFEDYLNKNKIPIAVFTEDSLYESQSATVLGQGPISVKKGPNTNGATCSQFGNADDLFELPSQVQSVDPYHATLNASLTCDIPLGSFVFDDSKKLIGIRSNYDPSQPMHMVRLDPGASPSVKPYSSSPLVNLHDWIHQIIGSM